MIGNDIVDISGAEKINWNRKDCLKKIFSKEECDLILNSNNPAFMFCLLWSMKESTYKIFQQQFLERSFNPLMFNCRLTAKISDLCEGEVFCREKKYFIKSRITEEYISTIAYEIGSAGRLFWDSVKCSCNNYKIQHNEVRLTVIKFISEKINRSPKDLFIKKDEYGIPRLYNKGNLLNISISLSHHGWFAAYAIAV